MSPQYSYSPPACMKPSGSFNLEDHPMGLGSICVDPRYLRALHSAGSHEYKSLAKSASAQSARRIFIPPLAKAL